MPSEQRDRWSSRTAFIMAAVGSAVGLGNLWRFPYVAFRGGGGAFFIPYFVALISAGIPLMIVEYAIGQKYQGGAPQALGAITRKFRWVGWFALLIATVICMYYVVVMAWAWHYCVDAFRLAWTRPVPYLDLQEGVDGLPDVQYVSEHDIVLYLKAPNEQSKQRLIDSQLGKAKPLPVMTGEEVQWAQKERGDESLRYVSLDENVAHYFSEKCLGGWQGGGGGLWRLRGRAQELLALAAELAQDAHEIVVENPEDAAELRAQAISLRRRADAMHDVLTEHGDNLFQLDRGLVLGAAATWLLIFFIVFRGVRNVGKVVMVTVPLPILLLLLLLLRGVTLEGATTGLLYYLTPNWEMLKDPQVWILAYGQIFFSLTLGFGVLIAYASYMPPESDVTGSAFITSFGNCVTSFVSGFAVFSVLGYLAYVNGVDVQDVAVGGPGLAFVTYPLALAMMPGGALAIGVISLLFFVCLLTLGIDSAFSLVEGLVTGFKDHWPKWPRWLLTGVFCAVGFAGSLLVCTRSGLMWLDILDNWTNNYGLVLVGLLECIAVGYFYHLDELKDYINRHSEIKVHFWFDAFIKVVTPTILVFLLARQFLNDIAVPYERYDMVLEHAVTFGGWLTLLGVFTLALMLGRNWRILSWIVAMVAVAVAFVLYFRLADPQRPVTETLPASIMAGIGAVLLFGGLITSIRVSRKTRHMAGLSLETMHPTEGATDEPTEHEPTDSELETRM